ncbi:MAG: hypothetical protein NTV89_16760, partial [Proteobacteria bacterium]|nr:hypothetical protein [Pseudomonadota bacterium]
LYRLTLQILSPCEFSQDSTVKIQDVRTLKVLTITKEQISVLVLVPTKLRIRPGPKMVTVQSGLTTFFTGVLVIQ